MTTDDERDSLAQELLRLSLPELVDVLRRVLPAHAQHGGVMSSTLVLAEIARLPDEDPSSTQPCVEVVAWPDRGYYNGGFGPEPANEEVRCAPRRVAVERTRAWLTTHRRLARDYERHRATSEAMIRWTAIGLMTRRLAGEEP